MSNSGSSGSGAIFFELLAVAFITLKLIGIIEWSWWWVLAPLWAPALLAIAIFAGLLVFAYIKRRRA